MRTYKITFYKNLLSSDGHPFRCPQQVIVSEGHTSAEAVDAAKREFAGQWKVRDWRQHADEYDVAMQDRSMSLEGTA
jgi:hypothetical protein